MLEDAAGVADTDMDRLGLKRITVGVVLIRMGVLIPVETYLVNWACAGVEWLGLVTDLPCTGIETSGAGVAVTYLGYGDVWRGGGWR